MRKNAKQLPNVERNSEAKAKEEAFTKLKLRPDCYGAEGSATRAATTGTQKRTGICYGICERIKLY
jgi:hypothetical protein